ncbi:IMPACT family protein [Rhodococcus sp. NPDC058521]|uniref:IMPACT family protein n=1 Tax=Rhodococcus sp. NPDC058521 TaxID=3346536 RepID=UPI0036547C42
MQYTLAGPVGTETTVGTEIKHSRFIATLRRIATEQDARDFLDEQRRLFPDARHHCWAYVVGDDSVDRIERSSDDGEPGGTAGLPMLQMLKGRDLVNVAAVVTRYFGGIKLGAGGLVRAYSGAVGSVVDQSRLIGRRRLEMFTLGVDHADAGRVESELRGRGVAVTDTVYAENAVLTLAAHDSAELENLVAATTSGVGTLEPAGEMWTDTDNAL